MSLIKKQAYKKRLKHKNFINPNLQQYIKIDKTFEDIL